MNPRVKSVAATADHRLELTFTNGEVGTYDCRHLLDFGVFRELRDVGYFLRARADGGTVVWPHEQDICPDTLYEDSLRKKKAAAAPRPTGVATRKRHGVRPRHGRARVRR